MPDGVSYYIKNCNIMPDKKSNIKTALDGLDDQVVDIVGNYVKRRRQHYEAAAKALHANLKEDAARYAIMLADQQITREDFDMLMKGRLAQLKIELLSEMSISKTKFEGIAGDVLKLTVNTLLVAI